MLTRQNRLRSSRDFSRTVRHGSRAGTRTVVVHLGSDGGAGDGSGSSGTREPQVGLVVGKAVGTAVTRNLVKRRLRHLTRERLSSLPGSAVLVVRALAPAATATFAQLSADLDRALERAVARASRAPKNGAPT